MIILNRFFLILVVPLLSGCAAFGLASAIGQSIEEQTVVEVAPEYPYLEGEVVAVLVDADLGIRYEHQNVVQTVGASMAQRLLQQADCRVINPRQIASWQLQRGEWNFTRASEIFDELRCTRLVVIDLIEYRLNPPGNRFLWEGYALATVNVYEADGFDPDGPAAIIDLEVAFPDVAQLTRAEANADQIELGLLNKFIKEAGFLFYPHWEAKFPERYRGDPIPTGNSKRTEPPTL